MHLIFDTETTDLYKKNIQATSPEQARICQFACLLLDEQFNEVASFSSLIRPNGWTIKPGAQAVHGISTERCLKHGIPMATALEVFDEMSLRANHRVAHNSIFDTSMIDVEKSVLFGYLVPGDWRNVLCTMMAMTDVCKLPPKWKGTKYKWPKLQEAYKHSFNQEFVKSHDALADVRACAAVYRWCIKTGIIILPKPITDTQVATVLKLVSLYYLNQLLILKLPLI